MRFGVIITVTEETGLILAVKIPSKNRMQVFLYYSKQAFVYSVRALLRITLTFIDQMPVPRLQSWE